MKTSYENIGKDNFNTNKTSYQIPKHLQNQKVGIARLNDILDVGKTLGVKY